MSEADLIQHVSDTSRWIAAYRALETERADAVFKDPFAARLAGERGMEMVKATPHTEAVAFAMVVRTVAIDRLVMSAIDRGVDTVINLGAGLDTRPYRMPLPGTLKWVEVDFPHVIDYKSEILQHEKPVCQLERIPADLSLEADRLALFAALDNGTGKAAIITEGVIAYLTNAQAAQMAKDLFAMPHFHYWIMDYSQGPFRRNKQTDKLQKKMVKNTPFRFSEADPLAFFGRQGWKLAENIYILDEGDRIGRRMPAMFPWSLLIKLFRKKMRARANATYGYAMLSRL
jgi:methyltransferase (TIGR00027 family)